jgi:uncharacterized membrane protein
LRNVIFSIFLTLFFVTSFVIPSVTNAEEVKVHAVLFYSPTCPHCHTVINEVLPPLIEKHGDNLLIIGIDVSNEIGHYLYEASITRFQIPDTRYGVPTLIVGDTVLVGSSEIPNQFPSIVEAGLSSNGIPWPDIPGLQEVLAEQGMESSEPEPLIDDSNPDNLSASNSTDLYTTVSQRFSQDIAGNSLAVVVLIGMITSIILVGYSFITGSILLDFSWSKWLIPVLSIIGLAVAVYLSYVDISSSKAVCGPVGDCNTVQESTYAYLFGIIPVGVIGIIGYIAILLAWFIQYFGSLSLQKFGTMAIWLMVWFGMIFSIYLTFLEPFVIGATCIWCITSAVIMTILLWISTPSVIKLWQSNDDRFDKIPEGEVVR